MNDTFYFSASTNSVRLESMRSLYTSNWPDDLVEVSRECFNEYTAGKTGKKRGVGEDGSPVWEDTDPPSKEALQEWAESEKNYKIQNARNTIQEWQSELILDIITDKNKESLKAWLNYISSLKALDVSAPDKIKWPKAPEE